MEMTRYHPLLVALHWVLAFMILLALIVGGPTLADMANTDPEKMFGLTGHMIWGMVIGTLLIVRIIVKMRSKNPPKADAKNAVLNLGAQAAHWGLYLLTAAMVMSGVGTAINAGLFGIIFGGNGQPIPADLMQFAPRVAHGFIANLMLALIILHVLGWAYHQFILRDKLISRMWFGKRDGGKNQ
ncbi:MULTISPECIES: cytochrome b [unclassified Lentilitoribacter]|jgi:cytochrome b561|uniref:cytochrome b n=1 Tax=unclassified Lentilitoribacter TaxID=2647570 RepID=UPI0013A6F7EA|nr:cytochrome b/b6 domain-containing protein [Lentilitoribacter sp. Alg239-R112]